MENPIQKPSGAEMLTIEGILERIIYQNEENGYSVCELEESKTGEPVTIVGVMPYIAEGEVIRAVGSWTMHVSFGKQFKVEYFEKQLPTTEITILKYLSSRAVKGIGPATAIKIVKQFGVDSFDVIENHVDWLASIPGISKKKAQEISDAFKEQFGVRNVMMFCRDFFGPTTALRIYKKWGGSAVDRIKENPYLLCDEINGIGFSKADSIAGSLGIEKTSFERIVSGIKYVLRFNAVQNGHVFLPQDKLTEATLALLEVPQADIEQALLQLKDTNQIHSLLIGERNCIYLTAYYNAEQYAASKLELLEKLCPKMKISDAARWIKKLEIEENIKYAKLQREAILDAVNAGVMVLTGGPGTGKTTVIRGLMRIFDEMGMEIALAAPTGRAAKRMSEATQREAKTIHRLLEMEYTENAEPRFKRDEKNLLEESVIIIDEASMVDIFLMEALLKAIKPGSRLLLIGDADQLPSVGAGNVLNDIMESRRFCTIKLTEIFRQAKESLIITNAHAINAGKHPELTIKNKDFFFLSRYGEEETAYTVADLCKNRLPKTYGEKVRNEIQVIIPSRKGRAGTEAINILLQETLNPPEPKKREKRFRNNVFREGDKIMQIKNNYDLVWEKDGQTGIGIFNGDIGVIETINTNDETMLLNFDERTVSYDFSMLEELELAYAITVHKSQGSEYPIVILPLCPYSPRLLTRNLLYTAVTRAQTMVVVVGSAEVLYQMVENNRQANRYTGLCYLLSQYST